jgi:very-short-patch-repair endonuclease
MPTRRTTKAGYTRAHVLRREPTLAESKLWAYLRAGKLRGVSFRRQHAIDRYVVDFCAPRHRLIIELDGSPHLMRREGDASRAKDLETRGYRVLRFWNDQIINDMEGVARAVLDALRLT